MKTRHVIIVAAAILLLFGGCTFSGNGYQADAGVSLARVQEAGATDRTRIETDAQVQLSQSRERSLATVVPWAALCVVVVCACAVCVALARRPSAPVAQPPARLLGYADHYGGTEICQIDGEWALIEPRSEQWRTLAQLDAMECKRLSG